MLLPHPLRAGLIGFGAIGAQVADGIFGGVAGDVDLVGIFTRRPRATLAQTRMVTDLAALLETRPDIVLEAASAAAVATCAEPLLAAGVSLILASTAALVDDALRARLELVCQRTGARVYLPAGALAGVDALSAAASGGLDRVALHVTEPRSERSEAVVVFQGDAAEAARRIPTRLNVAWTAALAAQRPVEVTLVEGAGDDPRRLELHVSGAFGAFASTVEPASDVSRLSHIVALSQLALLRRIQQPIQVG